MAVALVSAVVGTGNGTTTPSPAMSVTAGNLVIVWGLDHNTVSSISSSGGETWTPITPNPAGVPGTGGNAPRAWWAKIVSTNASWVVTTVLSGSSFPATLVAQFSGQDATSPIDTGSAAVATANGADFSVTSNAFAQADTVAIAAHMTDGGGILTYPTPSGWTKVTQEPDANSYWTGAMWMKQLSATTAQTFTQARGTDYTASSGQIFGIKAASGGGGDVTLALTGQDVTAAQGTLTAAVDRALTGSSLTAAQGSVGFARALSGQAISAAGGALTAAIDRSLAGQDVTATQGSVQAGNDITLALAGQDITAAPGTLAAAIDTALSGLDGSLAQGSVSAAADQSIALTGQAITIDQGTVSAASADVTLALSGLAMGIEQGTVIQSGGTQAERRMGFEVQWVEHKPILQRVLEARAERRVKPSPKRERAQVRARKIEQQAAQIVIDQPAALGPIVDLYQQWRQTNPVIPPQFAKQPLFDLFLASVLHRMKQQEAEAAAARQLQEFLDEEEAVAILLLS